MHTRCHSCQPVYRRHRVRSKEGGLPTLVGFRGATVSNASVKLVPLPKLYQEVQLNCWVSLKGLPSSQ